MMKSLGRTTGKIILRATAAFGLSYFFWLVFYFDFLKESLESVSPLIEPSALVTVPLSIMGLAFAVALIIAIATYWAGTTNFIRGVVIVGVVLSISSLVSIGLGSPLAWVSLVLAVAALFAVWKWQAARLVGLALLCGILGTGYALLTQGLWAWANWPATETESPAVVSTDSPDHNLPSVYVVVMDEFSLSLVNKYTSFFSLPNLSRLAQEGVYFPRAYAVSDMTEWSVPSFFTGSYLEDDIAAGQSSPNWLGERRNLITDLQGLGYQIKVYNDVLDICSQVSCSPLKVETESLAVISPADLRAFAVKHLVRQLTFGLRPAPNIGGLLQGQPARVFDLEHDPNQPQFVYIHLFDSHHEYRFRRDGSLNGFPYKYIRFGPNDEEAAPKVADNYFEQILWADTLAAPLVDALLTIPPEERIVVFSSDHGISWREPPFGRGLGIMNSTQVHVPLILLAPGLEPAIEPQLMPLFDVYPTVVELLNRLAGQVVMEPPAGIEGLSLFADPNLRDTRTHYAFTTGCKYKLREDSWVLERKFQAKPKPEWRYTDAPIPAQELALTPEAIQLAMESTVPRPLPPMLDEKQTYPATPPAKTGEALESVILIEEGFYGYDIFRYTGRFYGIRQGEGEFDYERFRAGGHKGGVEGDSILMVEHKIVEITSREALPAAVVYNDDETVWEAEPGITVSEEISIVNKGESSLKVTWDNSSGSIYYNLPSPQDWSASRYVSFYMYGANSNTDVAMQIRFRAWGGEDWIDFRWRDNFTGWKQLTFSLLNPTKTSGTVDWTDVQQVLFRPLTTIDAILYFDYLVRY